MNCKPGDLAVVVDSCCGNEGKIVRCIRLVSDVGTMGPDGFLTEEFCWETIPLLPSWTGELAMPLDSQLRPIRDPGDDAQDESLSWLPVPTKEIA